MKNQQLIKYFNFFVFFEDEKSNSGIFTIREGNKKPLPHEMVKMSFNMQKQLSKKNLFFLRENSSCREFTLWWKEETNLSHQRKVKTRMKIFIQNQCIIKKLKNFSFFWGDFDLSGIFTLCNKKIIFKWKVKLCQKDSLKNNNLSKILKNVRLRWYFLRLSWIFTLCQANKKNWKKWVRFFDFFTCSVCRNFLKG